MSVASHVRHHIGSRLIAGLMAPKSKSITELGTVARNGNGWRARVQVDRRNLDGPQRATQVEAQVDLDRARQSLSRGEMLTFLSSLAQQVRGEAQANSSQVSQPSGSSGVAGPAAEVGEASAFESGRQAQSDEPCSHNESKRSKTARCRPQKKRVVST